MIILTIRTDKPEAEIGLYDDQEQLKYEMWQAHRQLAESIFYKLQSLLEAAGKNWQNVEGIVAFRGPGSFTGLRIGLSVGNALSDGLRVPIVGMENPAWIENGIKRLKSGQNDTVALPEYGAPVHITKQKH